MADPISVFPIFVRNQAWPPTSAISGEAPEIDAVDEVEIEVEEIPEIAAAAVPTIETDTADDVDASASPTVTET